MNIHRHEDLLFGRESGFGDASFHANNSPSLSLLPATTAILLWLNHFLNFISIKFV